MRVKGINPTQLGDLRSKGTVATHITPWGMHMQKWPRKRGRAKEGYDLYRQIEFQIAAQLAKAPEPVMFQTALNLTKGSTWTYRDLMVRACMGLAYTITLEDGTVLQPARSMTSNPLYWLDLISDVPGSIVYRSDIGWVGLDPPNFSPALLQYSGGLNFEWVVPPTSGGGGSPDFSPPLASYFPTLLNSPTLTDSALGLGITGAANAQTLRAAVRTLPAVDRTIIARIQNSSFFSTSNGMCLVMRNSVTGKMAAFGGIAQNQAGASGLEYAAWAWNTGTSYNSNFGGGVSGTSDAFWVKIVYVASTHTWTMYCSLDGINWRLFHADASWLGTPDQYGVAAFAFNASVPPAGAITYWKETTP